MRDLGVTFDSQLNFKTHIRNIVNKAYQMYGFIVRNCRDFNNMTCIRTLYVSYIRSILEYCSVIWSPHYDIHRYSLEKVQNKMLRYINYKETGTYQFHIPKLDILKRYNLHSLESRRSVAYLLFLHKLINNNIKDPNLLALISFHVPNYQTRNPTTMYVDTARTNYYFNSPIISMCKLYNQVRDQCDIFNIDLNRFRKLLQEIL